MTKTNTLTAGIDTAKHKLDVAVHEGAARWQVENALPGWRDLTAKLLQAGVARVGIEASGGYERGVVRHLRALGFTVLVLQPIQVRAYARLHLRRAKNDALDAVLIAAFAATIDRPRPQPDARLAEFARHLTFVEQIEEDIARLKVRLEHVDDQRRRRIVITDIARLKARRAAELIALYARLMARGKAHNAALIACARKLLIYANTVVQRGTPWSEKPAPT